MRTHAVSSVLVGILLSGCSATIPVMQISDRSPPDHEGTLLVLPRTSLTVKYDVVKTTFTAGRWTDELERCEKLLNPKGLDTVGTVDRREFNGTSAGATAPRSCRRMFELDLASKRLSGKSICPADTFDSETRFGIDPKTLAVSGAPVPDPAHVYWVATPARWLGYVDVTVKYTSTGTVDGAKSVASNPWSDFAVNVASSVLKAAIAGGGSDNKPRLSKAGADAHECVRPDPDKPQVYVPDLLSEAECKELHVDLQQLYALAQERNLIVTTSSNSSIDAQIALADALIDARKALFEGKKTKVATPKSFPWIPALEREPGSGKLLTHEHVKKDVPAVHVCGAGYPSERLEPAAKMSASGKAIHAALEPALVASSAGFKRSDRGFPYRVPVDTSVEMQIVKCKLTPAPTDKDPPVEVCENGDPTTNPMTIAQFGGVGRLTPRAGGRKGTIEVDYNAETGALVSVQVVGEGSDPKPITDVLQAKLNPPAGPSPMDLLKAEKDRLEAMAAICKAYLTLAAEAPAYCQD